MKKHRILMGALALAVVAATLTGCKKENETASKVEIMSPTNPPSDDMYDCEENETDEFSITSFGYILDGEINEFSQWWNSEYFEWRVRDESTKSDTYVVVGDVTFDLLSLPKITITKKDSNGYSFTMESDFPDEVFAFNDISRKSDSLSFVCSTSSNINFSFFLTDEKISNEDEIEFLDFINEGDAISIVNLNGAVSWYNENTMCYLPILPILRKIWAAASIIAGSIAAYCNHVVTTGVNNCAQQNLPAQIGPGGCSVRCIEK